MAAAKAKITEITPAEAANERGAIVIDVRDRDEWETGHIPQARHLSRGLLEVEIEEIVPDPATPIILHCGAGGRSALAAQSLQEMGYTNVKSMAGGFKAWEAAGLSTEQSRLPRQGAANAP